MPRTIKPLTDTQVRSLRYNPDTPSQNILRDGDNLYIEVSKTNKKTWKISYKHPITNKENIFTVGNYPYISLADARQKRIEVRKLLISGIDPNQDKKSRRNDLQANTANTFQKVAEEWLAHRKLEEKKDDEVIRRFNHDVYPVIAELPFPMLTVEFLQEKVFNPIIERKALTIATKVKRDLFGVFEYARKTKRLISFNPLADISTPTKPSKPHPAITDTQLLKAFINDSWNYIDIPRVNPVTAYCLRLSLLIFQRPIEIRSLKWENYKEHYCESIGKHLDYMPVKQKNSNSIHKNLIIPLTDVAITILEELKKLTGHTEYIFYTGQGKNQPYLSENTLGRAIKLLSNGKYAGKHTAHGFRATARTILVEKTNQTPDVIEAQLAHKAKGANGESYNRAEFVEKRYEMLKEWEKYTEILRLN